MAFPWMNMTEKAIFNAMMQIYTIKPIPLTIFSTNLMLNVLGWAQR